MEHLGDLGSPRGRRGGGAGDLRLVLALDGRWIGVGWLFGAAVATQPVVVLMLPVLLALAGRSRVLPLLVRASLPSVLLLATPLAAEFHATVRALVDQPNFPNIDHRTPWTSFAPRSWADPVRG